MRKIGIIGAGSAGILSTSHMLAFLPSDWQVTLIHDPEIGIVGIGESTNPPFCNVLAVAMDFNLLNDIKHLDGTHKFGTLFTKWREHDILNPLIGGSCAIHFDTYKLREFAIPRLKDKWKNKFQEVRGKVARLENKTTHVEVEVDGVVDTYEYIIDCRGFPKDYTDYTICELPVNHCLVHNIPEAGEWKHTGHRATKNGWMFEIPLTTRQSYGYLFNNEITTKEDALKDFSEEIGVPVDQLQDIEYKFQSYYANKPFDGRICKNGNAAMFFEPMSANSLWAYFGVNQILFDYIIGNNRDVNVVNEMCVNNFKSVEEIIYYFYHGGSTYKNTPFWNHAVKLSTEKLKFGPNFAQCLEQFSQLKQRGIPVAAVNGGWIFSAYNLQLVDKMFDYNYFS